MHGGLVKPGPDLVICDEGHRIKNSHASISQSLKNIRTRYSIIHLTEPQEHKNQVQYYTPHRALKTSEPGTVLYTSQSLKNIRTRYSTIYLTEPQKHQNQVQYYIPHRA